MATTTFPYDGSGNGITNESRWSDIAGLFAPTGICLSYGNGSGFATLTGGLNFNIEPLLGLSRGVYCEFDSTTSISAVTGDAGGNRVDRYVVRRDFSTNSASIVRIAGTVATSPVAPAITRNSTIWDFKLCQIRVNQNATSILWLLDEREISSGVGNDTGSQILLGSRRLTSSLSQIQFTKLPINSFNSITVKGRAKSTSVIDLLLKLDGVSNVQSIMSFTQDDNGGPMTNWTRTDTGHKICFAPGNIPFNMDASFEIEINLNAVTTSGRVPDFKSQFSHTSDVSNMFAWNSFGAPTSTQYWALGTLTIATNSPVLLANSTVEVYGNRVITL